MGLKDQRKIADDAIDCRRSHLGRGQDISGGAISLLNRKATVAGELDKKFIVETK